jgi:hypothetical protein
MIAMATEVGPYCNVDHCNTESRWYLQTAAVLGANCYSVQFSHKRASCQSFSSSVAMLHSFKEVCLCGVGAGGGGRGRKNCAGTATVFSTDFQS